MNCRAARVALMMVLGGLVTVAQVPDGPMPPRPAPGDTGGGPPLGAGPGSAGAVAEAGVPPRGTRDPFWPVGYVPRQVVKVGDKPSVPGPGAATVPIAPAVAVAVAGPPDWEAARSRLEIKGISRIGRDRISGHEMYFADVNGRIVEDGDAVSVTWNGRVYRWRITQVSPTGIQFVKEDCRAE